MFCERGVGGKNRLIEFCPLIADQSPARDRLAKTVRLCVRTGIEYCLATVAEQTHRLSWDSLELSVPFVTRNVSHDGAFLSSRSIVQGSRSPED